MAGLVTVCRSERPLRGGVCYVPLTLRVGEVDAQDSGDRVNFSVSKATSY